MTKTKYRLLKAFHPKAFQRNVYAVSFYRPKKQLYDKNTRLYQVTAGNRKMAIKKARKMLG